jgi:hypothetical protein
VRRPGWVLAIGVVALGLGLAPRLRADLAPGPNDGPHAPRESPEQRLQRRERLERLRAGLASAFPRLPTAPAPAPSGSVAALSSARALELAQKWAELVATRHERRERHRAELVRELGARVSDPAVIAEVKLHTTRQAELERANFLALNARRGAEREKILARIAKLSGLENARHRVRMEKLFGPSNAGAASAPAPSSAAAPSSAPPASAPSAGSPR